MIRQASSLGLISHSMHRNLYPPVLQYADDTLILCEASVDNAVALKKILDDFASATGLAINFHKSSYVPMNTDPALASAIASVLGCSISSFPQPYLGLPLSPTKLPLSTRMERGWG